MAPRPKNPPPDRRQEILDAALTVFSAQGYSAATNAQIAREAGVTTAALYYYFPSKADLFRAVITEHAGLMTPNIQPMAEGLREMPPDMVLPFFVQAAAGFFVHPRTQMLLRIILSEGARHPELVSIWESHAIGPLSTIMFSYLRHQTDLGRLKPIDPRALFLMTGGPLLALTLVRDILGLPMVADITNEELARNVMEMLLPGLIPDTKE